MKKTIYITLTLIIIILGTLWVNHRNKVIFMNDFQKNLNGIYIDFGEFLGEKDGEKPYPATLIFYNKKFEKNFKDNKGIKILASNNEKIIFSSDKKIKIGRKEEKQIGNLMEYDVKTDKSIPLITTDYKYITEEDFLYDVFYFNDGILLCYEKKILFLENINKTNVILTSKDYHLNSFIIRDSNLYFENDIYESNANGEYYTFEGMYVCTKKFEILKKMEDSEKIWDVSKNEVSKNYSIKDFDLREILSYYGVSRDFYKREIFTKDKKYRIFFEKSVFFNYGTKIYVESTKTKKRVCIFKNSLNYVNDIKWEFKSDAFWYMNRSLYEWTIF